MAETDSKDTSSEAYGETPIPFLEEMIYVGPLNNWVFSTNVGSMQFLPNALQMLQVGYLGWKSIAVLKEILTRMIITLFLSWSTSPPIAKSLNAQQNRFSQLLLDAIIFIRCTIGVSYHSFSQMVVVSGLSSP